MKPHKPRARRDRPRARRRARDEIKPPQYYAPDFGERFKAARNAMHRSLRQVMDDTGIHRGTISDIEHERREPKIPNRDTLAAYYGVRREWLITGTGPMMQYGRADLALMGSTPHTNEPFEATPASGKKRGPKKQA